MTTTQTPKIVFSGPTSVTVAGLGKEWGIVPESVQFKVATTAIGSFANATTPAQYEAAINTLNTFGSNNRDIQAAAAGLRGVQVTDGTSRSFVGRADSTEIVR